MLLISCNKKKDTNVAAVQTHDHISNSSIPVSELANEVGITEYNIIPNNDSIFAAGGWLKSTIEIEELEYHGIIEE